MKHLSPFLLIIFVSSSIILLFNFKFDIFQPGDNCGYMILGMSFAEGKGFSNIALPEPIHFLWWPPGFPLFIALFYKTFGPSWYALKLVIFFLLYVSFLFYSFIIFDTIRSKVKVILILLACCFSSGIHLLSSYLYSETFYIACSISFLYLWYIWSKNITGMKIVILSILSIYIGSIRLIGMSLPFALIIYLILFTKEDRKLKLYGLIPLSLLIFYISVTLFYQPLRIDSFQSTIGLHTQFTSGLAVDSSKESVSTDNSFFYYFEKFEEFIRGYGLTLIPQSMVRTIYDLYPMNKIKAAAMAVITCLIVAGWCLAWGKNKLLNTYIFLYMGILYIYGPHYVRLLVPIIPFFLLYFYLGMEWTIYALVKSKKKAMIIFHLLWSVVIFDNVYLCLTDPKKTMPAQFGDKGYQDCIEWIVKHSKPNQVILSQVSSYLFLRRGKYSIPYFGAKTSNEVISYLDIHKVKYLIISPFYRRSRYTYMTYVNRAVQDYPERFKNVFREKKDGSYILEYSY